MLFRLYILTGRCAPHLKSPVSRSLNAGVEDSSLGIRVVKSFANEDMEEQKFRTGNEHFFGIKRQAYRYMAGFDSSVRFSDGLMYIAVVVVGALFMIDGRIDAPQLVAFLLYISLLLTSIRNIVQYMEQFQRGMTGIERFIEIMDAPVEIDDAENASICLPSGEIRSTTSASLFGQQPQRASGYRPDGQGGRKRRTCRAFRQR